MIRFFSRHTVLGRLEIAMTILAVAATLSFVNLVIFAENTTGKASAINIAGSLRMQSYAVALTLTDTSLSGSERSRAVEQAVLEFDRRLNHPNMVAALSSDAQDSLTILFVQVRQQWNQQLRPLVMQVAAQPSVAPQAVPRIRRFVGDVDEFVARLDQALERQITILKRVQAGLLFLMLITILAALFILHKQLNNTLSNLLRLARDAKEGNFSVRAPVTGGGEFGELAQAFNLMAENISRMYVTLEDQVAQKTAALKRSNRTLSLLYETGRLLSNRPLTPERLQQVLHAIEVDINLPAVVICAFSPSQELGFPVAVNGVERLHATDPSTEECAACHASTTSQLRTDRCHPGGHILNVPLMDADRCLGTMPVMVPMGTQIAHWQIELLEAVGRQIGAAMAGVEFSQQERRVALFEERTVIARELHDSLAQSLSYLKIQLTRLTRTLGAKELGQTHDVIVELRNGLNDAYRHLRELLTTFRMHFDGRGLSQALDNMVEEFRQRGITQLHVANTLADIELSANEQIHVLQIIREALANVEHHAHTPRAWVLLKRVDASSVCITIEDDGVGDQSTTPVSHHYGICIMRERAESLGGSLSLTPRASTGTCVELRFQPHLRQPDAGIKQPTGWMAGNL